MPPLTEKSSAEANLSSETKTTDPRFRNTSALIVKVTHRCNLDCAYCYENITKGEDMHLDTFMELVDRVFTSTRRKRVLILFHGGEPTLMPNDWFVSAVQYAKAVGRVNEVVPEFAIQSNILALDEKKIHLLKALGVFPSVSIDGPSEIATMRPRADLAARKFKMLQANGLKPGLLTTINHSNFNRFTEICRWFENELEVKAFKANVVSSVGTGINLPDLKAEHVFQASIDILEYMIASQGKGLLEDNLGSELVRFSATPEERKRMPISLCREKKCGAGSKVLSITPDGKLLPCGRFQWDDAAYYLGSLSQPLTSSHLDEFERAVDSFHSLVPASWYDCDKCDAKQMCAFGCQAFIVRSRSQANVECLPTKMRFNYYTQNRSRLEPVIERLREIEKVRESIVNYGDNSYVDYKCGPYSDVQYNDYSCKSN